LELRGDGERPLHVAEDAELEPRSVVAGHKNKDLPDDPAILDQTRRYLREVIRLPAPRDSGGRSASASRRVGLTAPG
jgi:hypothetical protein